MKKVLLALALLAYVMGMDPPPPERRAVATWSGTSNFHNAGDAHHMNAEDLFCEHQNDANLDSSGNLTDSESDPMSESDDNEPMSESDDNEYDNDDADYNNADNDHA